MFIDRADAGRRLAEKLVSYTAENTVVLALPRGGVVLGRVIAEALDVPLDIVVTRKIGHPSNPEYAICAVDEKGTLLCNEDEVQSIDNEWLQKEKMRQQNEAQRRCIVYRNGRKPVELKGKTVIITDDGIATGLTMRLAIAAVRAHDPQRIIVAVPVAPADIIEDIKKEVDELIILEAPQEFLGAVGAHYEQFDQVEDEEVIQLLTF